MTHREKVDRLIVELTAKGVKKRFIAPPMYRWLWALGIEIPPPLCGQSAGIMFLMGVLAAVGMCLVYWLSGAPNFLWHGMLFGGAFALLVWPVMYLDFRWKAKRLGLPTWEEYGRAAENLHPHEKD